MLTDRQIWIHALKQTAILVLACVVFGSGLFAITYGIALHAAMQVCP